MQTVTFNLGLEGIKNQVVALRIAQAKAHYWRQRDGRGFVPVPNKNDDLPGEDMQKIDGTSDIECLGEGPRGEHYAFYDV